MSTKALSELIETFREKVQGDEPKLCERAHAELTEIRKAAEILTRLNIGDFVYEIRNYANVLRETTTGNTWNHPDVRAWGNAAELLRKIAEEE